MPRLGWRHPTEPAHASPALSSAACPLQRSVPGWAGSPVPLPWHSPCSAVPQSSSARAAAASLRDVSELLSLGCDRRAGYLSHDWKALSLVPFWLDISFIIGGRKCLVSLKDTQPGREEVFFFVEDQIWSVLSNFPLLAVPQETTGFKRSFPFCAGFMNVSVATLTAWLPPPPPPPDLSCQRGAAARDGEERKLFVEALARAVEAPSVGWDPAPWALVTWGSRGLSRVFCEVRCPTARQMPLVHLAWEAGVSWHLPYHFGISLYYVLLQVFSVLPTAIKLLLSSLSFCIHASVSVQWSEELSAPFIYYALIQDFLKTLCTLVWKSVIT